MSLFDRLKKSSDPVATATIANIATNEGESVAKVAKIAVATPPNEKPEIPSSELEKESLPKKLAWNSPLFGRLEAGPVLEQGPDTFTLRHPLTQEIVELPNEWLVSLDERSAILEYDAGLPREEADRVARIEFFGLFRKGGTNAKRG